MSIFKGVGVALVTPMTEEEVAKLQSSAEKLKSVIGQIRI